MFAAGNGKTEGDNCACDGYVNSIYTIVVASCDDSGHVAHYSERCASIMATAYSGSGQEKNVVGIMHLNNIGSWVFVYHGNRWCYLQGWTGFKRPTVNFSLKGPQI